MVMQIPLSLQLASSVVADLLISGPLIYYLWANITGLERTDNIINTLIMWTVETALLTGYAPFKPLDQLLPLISYSTASLR